VKNDVAKHVHSTEDRVMTKRLILVAMQCNIGVFFAVSVINQSMKLLRFTKCLSCERCQMIALRGIIQHVHAFDKSFIGSLID